MKKLYLFLAAMSVAVGMNAATFKFFLGDTEIESGSTVYFNDIDDIDTGSGFDVTMAPPIYVQASSYTSKANLTLTCLTGQSVQCCIGGQCSTGTTINKKSLKLQGGQKVALEFEYLDFIPEGQTVPVVMASIEIQDGDNAATYKKFNVQMGQKNSVSVVEATPVVRVTPRGIVYNVEGSALLRLYNASGSCMFTRRVSGSGVIGSDVVPAGMYIYQIAGDVTATGKVALR